MGGLAAAIRLARHGCEVQVVEAGSSVGGLASGLSLGGIDFDAGPYVLLDQPGLAWAFEQLGLDLEAEIPLRRLDEVYQVLSEDGTCVSFYDSLERTTNEFDRQWPGQGESYRQFVQYTDRLYHLLQPLQRVSHPGAWELMCRGAWPAIPFLLSSLGPVLRRTCLLPPVLNAISIWTHVAGQKAAEAASPMAFVPAVIHRYGAFTPVGGIHSITDVLGWHAGGGRPLLLQQPGGRHPHAWRPGIGGRDSRWHRLSSRPRSLQCARYRHLPGIAAAVAAASPASADAVTAPVARRLCLSGCPRPVTPAVSSVPPSQGRRAVPPAGRIRHAHAARRTGRSGSRCD